MIEVFVVVVMLLAPSDPLWFKMKTPVANTAECLEAGRRFADRVVLPSIQERGGGLPFQVQVRCREVGGDSDDLVS